METELILQTMIVKRNGEVVNFDSSKIKNAVTRAVIATDAKIDEFKIDAVVAGVVNEIRMRFVDFYPNVENIQDLVEKYLVKEDLYEIAKAYILYREERRKEREQEGKENLEKVRLGKLRIRSRSGVTTLFDSNKLKEVIKLAAESYESDVSVELIFKEVVRNIYDGVSTEELEKALVLASISFIEKDPAYGFVASRLFMYRLFREVVGESMNGPNKDHLYRRTLSFDIQKGVEEGIFDKRMLDYDLEKLSKALRPERDSLLQYMGLQTLYERYFAKIENKRLELPQIFWMRVAMGLALGEENKNEKAIEFYEILSTLRFVSSTPTLFHAGTAHAQLSSCYLNTVMDDLNHIFKVYGDNANLSKWSGGIGTDWTNIRAVGSIIKSNHVESQGVIPFLKIANDVTVAINRSGKRRGATCSYLETWHLDIEEFLDLRKNTGDERRRTHDMNTANWIPDLFMKRVLEDGEWTLFSPDEVSDLHHIYGRKFEKKYKEYEERARSGEIIKFKVVSATKLWRKMLSMLFETGHPWFTFKDPCNIRSPQDHAGVIHNSNLCTEITLNTSADETAVCNLGSIHLGKHIINGKLDENLMKQTIETAVRMLDNVIDLNYYPTIEGMNSNMKHRPIGLGIMGFQDALYLLDMNFDSQDALEFSDKSMEMISYYAILASSKLAKEKGAYPSYIGSKWSRGIFPLDTLDLLEQEREMKIDVPRTSSMNWAPVKQHVKEFGMRNSNVMAIAPTATIGTIAGAYPCIEPIYKNIYVKANMSGEFTVINPYLVSDLKKLGLWNDEMVEQLKYYDGNLQMIGGIPDKLKEKYKEVFDIEPKVLIDLAAVRGKWIDQSQSLNIFMKGVSGKRLSETYMYAWQKGLKTTYYLRSLAASQIEKSTLDASKYGFTQKRKYDEIKKDDSKEESVEIKPVPQINHENLSPELNLEEKPASTIKACLLDDPDCEACQ